MCVKKDVFNLNFRSRKKQHQIIFKLVQINFLNEYKFKSLIQLHDLFLKQGKKYMAFLMYWNVLVKTCR